MNWLDWLLIALLALAAFKGFQRGFIIELASLAALVLGIWIAARADDRVGDLLGIPPERSALAFLATFALVLVAVHLLARGLTMLIDLAALGPANKLAGVAFGLLRSLFVWSIALNLVVGWSGGDTPPRQVRAASSLCGPVMAFAPLIIPPLGGTKWVQEVMERVRKEADAMLEDES